MNMTNKDPQQKHFAELQQDWEDERIFDSIEWDKYFKGKIPAHIMEVVAEKALGGEPLELRHMFYEDLRLGADIKGNKTIGRLLKRKRREFKEELERIREQKKRRAEELTAPGGSSILNRLRLQLECRRVEIYEECYERFTYYIRICEGKVKQAEQYDLVAIKEVPCSQFLPGNPMKKSPGREFYKCPLHDDDTPSFCYYIEQNSWWCYGCSEGSDVIDLVQKLEGIDFKQAITILKQHI